VIEEPKIVVTEDEPSDSFKMSEDEERELAELMEDD